VAPTLNPGMTMAEAFHTVATSRPGQEALVCGEVRLTYGELLDQIAVLAQGLANQGIRKGDKIAALLPPGPDFVTLFFAAAERGAVLVPLDPQLRLRRLGQVLDDAEPAMLVTGRPLGEDSLEAPSSLRHLVYTAAVDDPGPTLGDLMDGPGETAPPPVEMSPHDLLTLLYTSGTSGVPKGTMHSHRSLIVPVAASIKLRELWLKRPTLRTVGQMAVALARYKERLLRAVGKPQTFLSTVGWHTITGLEVMLQALLMGDRLVVMPRFHPREALRLVEAERVTVLVAVPMAFQVMLSLDGFETYDTSSLLICGTGSAPCPPHLARQMRQRFGCAVHIGFGATETAGGIAATSIADSDQRQAETVGRPMPGVELKVVDEARRELPRGQVGELACRSDSVMLGYYRAPDMSAQVLDEDGWYYTGDLAVLDEQGYLRIVGRKKDLIIRGGQNVYPAEIENVLAAHPQIREAAVVGVPASVGGERVWAFILLEDGAGLTPREVVAYCRQELEPYKIPCLVRIVDAFPRSSTGKPQKFKLRETALGEREGEDPT
jgi:fatty-acyl-CoA synthase